MGNNLVIKRYSEQQIEFSKIAKAIAHPARIAILEILNQKACTCTDIVNTLPIAQSTVSQHLKALKKVGLINGTDQPPKTIYTLNKQNCGRSKEVFCKFFNLS
jgi:ArsR family transcriptional regulator, arsenate/arsenite/antimonite-responsive transcriptional repressor